MENEDDSGSSEDFDAVPLDFLFDLDPWLFGGLDGDSAAAAPAPAAPMAATTEPDVHAPLLSPPSLSAATSALHFAPPDMDSYAPSGSIAASAMLLPSSSSSSSASAAAPPALSTLETAIPPPPTAPAPPRLMPGPPPSRSFMAALTSGQGAAAATTRQSTSSAATSTRPARKKAKPNKSTSQRQKEELTFLRSKVEALEEELVRLKSGRHSNGTDKSVDIKSEAPPQVVELEGDDVKANHKEEEKGEREEEEEGEEASLWELIAKRQQEEKTKSEVENIKLREMVENQIKLVRSFERLLRKRQIWEQLQEEQWQKNESQAKRDDEIFDELLASVDARRPLFKRIFETNALHNASPEGGDANLKYAPTNGMFIEFKDTKFLPFDHVMIDRVMWRSICGGKIKLEGHTLVTTKAQGDAVMSKSIVGHPGCLPQPSTVWSTVKRFAEADQVIYIYESSVVIASMPGTALPPVRLVQQGWGRIGAATLRDGSEGTVMQSYSTSVPTVLEAGPGGEQRPHQQHREIDILTELIFTSYQQSKQMLHQIIENLVLDEALARNTSGDK